jgi:hypothetical protein
VAKVGNLGHPWVELTLGDAPTLTVPPEHLIEMRYTSRLSGSAGDRLSLSLFDATFVTLEAQLLGLDPLSGASKKPIRMRWGWPDQGPGLPAAWTFVRHFEMISFAPTFSTGGVQVNIEAAPWTSLAKRCRGGSYKGSISTVVREMAREMGFRDDQIFVEDTEDFAVFSAGAHFSDFHGPQLEAQGPPSAEVWSVGNSYVTDYINIRMKPIARAKGSGEPFEDAQVRGGPLGPEFHFHPPRPAGSHIETFNFKTYFGITDDVVLFKPTFQSSYLGAIGRRGVVAHSIDPDTKGEQKHEAGPQHDPAHPSFDLNQNPSDEPTMVLSVSSTEADKAQAEVDGAWTALYFSTQKATLEFHCARHTLRFSAEVIAVVDALLRDGSPHWSGGTYRVAEAVHTIGAGVYTVSADLFRNPSDDERTRLQRAFASPPTEIGDPIISAEGVA